MGTKRVTWRPGLESEGSILNLTGQAHLVWQDSQLEAKGKKSRTQSCLLSFSEPPVNCFHMEYIPSDITLSFNYLSCKRRVLLAELHPSLPCLQIGKLCLCSDFQKYFAEKKTIGENAYNSWTENKRKILRLLETATTYRSNVVCFSFAYTL